MQATKIYRDEWEVDARLASFEVTREELQQAVQLTAAARADSVPDDPASAAGQLSYIYGTRYIRQLFRPKGWLSDNQENIAAVLEPKTGRRIVYQNVIQACQPFASPRAISAKGAAACRMVDVAQGQLFDLADTPEVVPLSKIHSLNSQVWYLCVSFENDNVLAELSLPATIEDGNFSGFLERIFISDGAAPPLKVGAGGEPPIEFEPQILRK